MSGNKRRHGRPFKKNAKGADKGRGAATSKGMEPAAAAENARHVAGDSRDRSHTAEGQAETQTSAGAISLKQPKKVAPRIVMELRGPVFFVGFMGAGKTSVARYLARTCGIASVDADTYLERRENRKVKDIFAEDGEAAFRAIETDVLDELSRKETPLLISCGGGVVGAEANRRLLADAGTVVFLKVTADEAASRISNLSTRPLFSDIEAARRLCEERMPLYEEVADIVIETQGRSVRSIAGDVRRKLEEKGVLCRQPV